MKTVIRKSTFETNSSSAHAFTFREPSDSKLELCKQKLVEVTEPFDKLLVLVGACQLVIENSRIFLVRWFEHLTNDYDYARALVNQIVKLDNLDKIAQSIEENPKINKDALASEKKKYDKIKSKLDCNFYQWLVAQRSDLLTILNSKSYIDDAINAYVNVTKEPLNTVINKIKNNSDKSSDPVCRMLFDESPLEECNCGLDDYISEIGTKYKSMTELANKIFNNELIVFKCEAWYSCCCFIEDILDDKDW